MKLIYKKNNYNFKENNFLSYFKHSTIWRFTFVAFRLGRVLYPKNNTRNLTSFIILILLNMKSNLLPFN